MSTGTGLASDPQAADRAAVSLTGRRQRAEQRRNLFYSQVADREAKFLHILSDALVWVHHACMQVHE